MKKVTVKHLPDGRKIHFTHRDHMRNPHGLRKINASRNSITVPATTLPVDSTNLGAIPLGPTQGNAGDGGEGDCGEAMVARADNILTYGQGKGGWTESVFQTTALLAQYNQVSGGDNGLDEDQVTNSIWKVGIAGNAQATAIDFLDFDITNIPLTQYLIDQFYTIQMGWSVPDAFISGFSQGTVWADAMAPNENNGHFTTEASVRTGTLSGVTIDGFYELYTWDAWCYAGPAFIASVQPQAFVAFSTRQFNSLGYDSKGRHITAQAALWVSVGGSPIPTAVLAAFPPPGSPVVTPPVVPPVVTPPTTLSIPLTAGWWDKPSGQLHIPTGWTHDTNAINLETVVHKGLQKVDVPKNEWNLV